MEEDISIVSNQALELFNEIRLHALRVDQLDRIFENKFLVLRPGDRSFIYLTHEQITRLEDCYAMLQEGFLADLERK